MLLLRQHDSTPSWPESIDKNKPLSLRSDLVSAIRPTLGNLHLQSDNLSSWLIGPKCTGPSKTIIRFPICPVSLKCRKVPSARDPQPDPRTTLAMIPLQSSSQMALRRIASILRPSRSEPSLWTHLATLLQTATPSISSMSFICQALNIVCPEHTSGYACHIACLIQHHARRLCSG